MVFVSAENGTPAFFKLALPTPAIEMVISSTSLIGTPSSFSGTDVSRIPPDVLAAAADPRVQQIIRAVAGAFGITGVNQDRLVE